MKKIYSTIVLSLAFAFQTKAQGFVNSPINWPVPSGGHISSTHTYGFDAMFYSGNTVLNNVAWSSIDINGDGKQDIVVTAVGDGAYLDVPGVAFSPYWKVYLNNGNGFATSPINWPVPTGGHVSSTHTYGFDALFYSGNTVLNNVAWSTTDINGDSKPDIVVTAVGDGAYLDAPGVAFTPYWKVYLNNGNGFATSPINWPVPTGGHISSTHTYGFDALFYGGNTVANNMAWSTIDINGDSKPDIVSTGVGGGSYLDVWGVSFSPYWRVYLNNGNGFATSPVNWPVPTGGHVSSTHTYGFEALNYGGNTVLNNVAWSTTDINGDDKPDIVVTAVGDGAYLDVPGVSFSPYWKVYLNNGNGFATSPNNWPVPSGGHISSTPHTYGFDALFYGGSTLANNMAWSTVDMNGDSRPDIVSTAVGSGSYLDVWGVSSTPYWRVYWNNGNGFSTSPTNWSVPTGGHISSTHTYGFDALNYSGNTVLNNPAWSTTDMNGDGTPDLVTTAVGDGAYLNVWGVSSTPYWRVYLNATNVTGIDNKNKDDKGIAIYPNPSKDKFYINAQQLDNSIEVYSSLGKLVMSSPIDKENETEIDLSRVPAGIYYVKIGSLSKKIVKE